MATRKVVRMKKRFQPNIAIFIFILILIYIGALIWGYVKKEHISIYEVNTSEIRDDSPLYGFIVRSEEVVRAKEGGYINYYNAEGNRVGVGDVVYTVDSNGDVASLLEQLQESASTSDSVTDFREVIASFQNSLSLANYSQVDDFQFDIHNVILEQSRGTLYSDMNKAAKKLSQSQSYTKVNAAKSGVISYSMDGYEDITEATITTEIMDEYGKSMRDQVSAGEMIEAGEPAYKLITSNDWYLLVELDEDYYKKLMDLDTVRVTVDKDGIAFNASVELFDRDGVHFAKLGTSRYMERYINDRFLKIRFQLKTAKGLKIPNSSILEKQYYTVPEYVLTKGDGGIGVLRQGVNENGAVSMQFVPLGDYEKREDIYYVSTDVLSGGDILLYGANNKEEYIVSSAETLSGTYCVNQGYCEFRPIDIQYQNNEYTIVSDSTDGGLKAYDHIVVAPENLRDDDFIN